MKKDPRKMVGRRGEEVASLYLVEKGFVIVERNWHTRQGELDLVAQKENQLIFVEVRTTSSNRFGYGFQSVDHRKQQKVRRLALQYLQQRRLFHMSIRFDVISVLLNEQLIPVRIDHIEGAF